MQKHDLASQLRERQYKHGEVERSIIDALSDDDIIDSYVTCSHCGEKQVDAQQLQMAIDAAFNADSFFRICDTIAIKH